MKFNMNQQEILDKLFILGFVWITPMSFVGILRSSLMWILVNGVEINLPIREYIESIASKTEEEVQSSNQEDEAIKEEEEVQSSSKEEEASQEEEENTLQKGLTKMWGS